MIALTDLVGCMRTGRADRETLQPSEPVRKVTAEPGVVPAGTSLLVRTNDTISTKRAYRDTIYEASLAEDVLDQNGVVLIPKGSPVDLAVFSFAFLGPGGAGMTELVLGLRAVTLSGVTYRVNSAEPPRAGGLGADDHTAKWVGGAPAGEVLTRGSRINVPSGTLLRFQTTDPIRLRKEST